MKIYLWSERIIGMFDRTTLPLLPEKSENQAMAMTPQLICYDLKHEDVKSYILTDSHELHCSNVNVLTLRRRWKQAMSDQQNNKSEKER